MSKRLPAEWEPQDAVQLAWPPSQGAYGPTFEVAAARAVFAQLAAAITQRQRLLLIANQANGVREALTAAGARLDRVQLRVLPFNDFWSRDFGPITIMADGRPELLDFTFNGWGSKYAATLDDQVTRRLHVEGAFGHCPLRTVDMVLEGGSLDTDGQGTLMTTSHCLLSPKRNAGMTRNQVETSLKHHLGCDRVLWLDHGGIQGDDTDSHVDMLARFAGPNTILYSSCPTTSDWHHGPLKSMQAELEKFRTRTQQPYRLLPLPIPAPIHDRTGRRLAASYANFLVINGAVLLPVYGDPNDEVAKQTLAIGFPDREIIPIDCRPLILENGSLHCVTMQLPAGALAPAK